MDIRKVCAFESKDFGDFGMIIILIDQLRSILKYFFLLIRCHFQKKSVATNMKENNETLQMFGSFVISIGFHGKSFAKTARFAFFLDSILQVKEVRF